MYDWRKEKFFWAFRLVAFLCLLGVVVARLLQGDRSAGLLVHIIVVPLWFVPTLWIGLLRPASERSLMLRNTLFAVMDVNLVMMAAAALEAAAAPPYHLLGGYVFLAAALGGPVAGGACAISGFIGFFNGWLLPAEFSLRSLLVSAGTATAGAVAGVAWRYGWMVLARALLADQARRASDPGMAARLADMEARLQVLGEERDRAQERVSELEEECAKAALAPVPEPAPEPVSVDAKAAEGEAESSDSSARISELEEELARCGDELKALRAEKRNLMTEISSMSKELMAAYSPRAASRAADPAKGEAPQPAPAGQGKPA